MSGGIRFHPLAVHDAEAAVEWYAERSGRTAALFLAELEAVIGRIAANPREFPHAGHGTRRAVFHRFPYLVVFREMADAVEIVAVAHGRRHPYYWKDRLV